jgi:hypothetical protein
MPDQARRAEYAQIHYASATRVQTNAVAGWRVAATSVGVLAAAVVVVVVVVILISVYSVQDY